MPPLPLPLPTSFEASRISNRFNSGLQDALASLPKHQDDADPRNGYHNQAYHLGYEFGTMIVEGNRTPRTTKKKADAPP